MNTRLYKAVAIGGTAEFLCYLPWMLGLVDFSSSSFPSALGLISHAPGILIGRMLQPESPWLVWPIVILPSLLIWIVLSSAVLKLIDNRKKRSQNNQLEVIVADAPEPQL